MSSIALKDDRPGPTEDLRQEAEDSFAGVLPLSDHFGTFIVWPNAAALLDPIINDLKARFRVVYVDAFHWTPHLVAQNYRRFYFDDRRSGIDYVKDNGTGSFTVITVRDSRPRLVLDENSGADDHANSHLLDAWQTYLKWTGGHAIHCSATASRTARDLTLLYGADFYAQLCREALPRGGERRTLLRDITGAEGWKSLREMYATLNRTIRYVRIRNDVDERRGARHNVPVLLTDDYPSLHTLVNPAWHRHRSPNGGRFTVSVGDVNRKVELLFTDDGRFDAKTATEVLASRVLNDRDIFLPQDPELLFSVATSETHPTTCDSPGDLDEAVQHQERSDASRNAKADPNELGQRALEIGHSLLTHLKSRIVHCALVAAERATLKLQRPNKGADPMGMPGVHPDE